MAVTQEELERFHRFAIEQIENGGTDLTLDELWARWRIENPTPDEYRENVLAIKASLRDWENGERGIPVEKHIQEMREKYNLAFDR